MVEVLGLEDMSRSVPHPAPPMADHCIVPSLSVYIAPRYDASLKQLASL